MPIYDYICGGCGERIEVVHGVHAAGPVSCERCGGGPMRKAMVAPAVHFKGTGWAKKERASGGVKPARDPGAPVGGRPGSEGAAASEATPAGAGGSATAGEAGTATGSGSTGNSGGSSGSGASSSTGKPTSSGSAEG